MLTSVDSLGPTLPRVALGDERGVRRATSHELLLKGSRVFHTALVRRVDRDAPATAVDPVVPLDQLGERVPGRGVERPDSVGRFFELRHQLHPAGSRRTVRRGDSNVGEDGVEGAGYGG